MDLNGPLISVIGHRTKRNFYNRVEKFTVFYQAVYGPRGGSKIFLTGVSRPLYSLLETIVISQIRGSENISKLATKKFLRG
jgi:hypothetical protein